MPRDHTIVSQRVCITLSTRLWGERDGVIGVSSAVQDSLNSFIQAESRSRSRITIRTRISTAAIE